MRRLRSYASSFANPGDLGMRFDLVDLRLCLHVAVEARMDAIAGCLLLALSGHH